MSHAQYQNPALEEFANGSAKRATRIYLERLAFTQRGRFAYLVGLVLTVLFKLHSMVTRGVKPDLTPGVPDPTLVESIWNTLGMGLLLVTPVLAGVAVLLALDVYEEEIGLVIDDG